MTALAHKNYTRRFREFRTVELPGKVEQVYQGGRACFDTSTGLVAKAFASTTLVPIGIYVEDGSTPAGGKVLIHLDNMVTAEWLKNSGTDPVLAAQLGSNCFLADDQTVAATSASNTLSKAGRVWDLDATKGVLVEQRVTK